MNHQLEAYNTSDTLLVLTSYPNPKNGRFGKRVFNAVGEHSERRLPYIAQNRKVLVVAEDINTEKYFSPEKNIFIARVWKKGNIPSILSLASFVLKQNHIRSILVQFEFNVLGGIPANLALLLVMTGLRLCGKKITFEMHQVLTDISKVEKHIAITNPVMQLIYNYGLAVFYTLVGTIVNQVIVFEQEMKNRLKQFVSENKIHVLCLSVDMQSVMAEKAARKLLKLSNDEFVLLVFGYINGYKGIDWLLDSLKDINQKAKGKQVRLVIAGGQNPYLKDKPFYQEFYASIMSEIKKYGYVTYTNFVPDEDVYLYYSAADLVIMPYIAFMSASGPFSRALAHAKPIILSKVLLDYSKSADFAQALQTAELKTDDLFFSLQDDSIIELINRAKMSKTYLKQLSVFSTTLAQLRSMDMISEKLDQILFTHVPERAILPHSQVAISN